MAQHIHTQGNNRQRTRTTAQFLLPFFCASKKGSRRKGEITK
jgi:hypothetical protein